MRSVFDKLVGSQVITDTLTLHGMIVGNAVVKPTGVLHLHGLVAGDLTIEPGGHVHLHGMVTGGVDNGGYLRLSGMVTGSVFSQAGASTILVPGAVINGVKH